MEKLPVDSCFIEDYFHPADTRHILWNLKKNAADIILTLYLDMYYSLHYMFIQRVLKHGIKSLYIFSGKFRMKFLKNAVIQVMKSCNLIEAYWCLRGRYYLHLQKPEDEDSTCLHFPNHSVFLIEQNDKQLYVADLEVYEFEFEFEFIYIP
jgi:hypothetical protein